MSEAAKKRLDQVLVLQGLCESRARAQSLIESGAVMLDGQVLSKPSSKVAEDAALQLTREDHPWVSRGGLKLVGALDAFDCEVSDLVCMDVGSSTGGFTDVLLHHGARRVFAVDVGRDQLAGRLREDGRVVVMEQTNARHLCAEDFPEARLPELDLVVCDASFISLKLVLPKALELVREGGALLALIKPQFEVGRDRVGKGGIVRDSALHAACCEDIKRWLVQEQGWSVRGLRESPITGPDGNREFLIWACK
ncbi:TlyA family RNA methyltransferase [Kiloniella sp. b19]|uniref:TlyA family RNA methyltransferase n=1 Tax=Kiloniella sp. GXU_MW_B19 TaxID=3141326 RepID=UPI0031D728BA